MYTHTCTHSRTNTHIQSQIQKDDPLSVNPSDFCTDGRWEGWSYPGFQSEPQHAAKRKTLRSNSNHEGERERYSERGREGGTDRECGDTLVCISSYSTSRVKGTNTFFLEHLKFRLLQCRKHSWNDNNKMKRQASVLLWGLARVHALSFSRYSFHPKIAYVTVSLCS